MLSTKANIGSAPTGDNHARDKPQSKLLQKYLLLGRVAGDPRLTRSDVAVAFYILERFNAETGEAHPSLKRIAEAVSRMAPEADPSAKPVARSTVVAAVRRLVEFGYFARVSGDKTRANEYRPCFEQGRREGTPRPDPAPRREAANTVGVKDSVQVGVKPGLHSISETPLGDSVSLNGKSADARESEGKDGAAILDLAMESAMKELRSEGVLASRGFELLKTIYPRKDQDLGMLAGAWRNAVVTKNRNVKEVLLTALVWRLYADQLAGEYVPPPGKWLRDGCRLPPRLEMAEIGLDNIDEAVSEGDSYEAMRSAFCFVSPFGVLVALKCWADPDPSRARGAFNRQLAGGADPEAIIRAAEGVLTRVNSRGVAAPMLGKWLSDGWAKERKPPRYGDVIGGASDIDEPPDYEPPEELD